MDQPLISCIVPVFNGERYLGEALDSILAQTYRPLEIIVSDDGSTDGTAAVVASYGECVKYLWQVNAGEAAARNLGSSAAGGHFLAFLDADDLWHPEKPPPSQDRLVYEPPQLNIYRDMGDLLALDPPVPGLGDPWMDPGLKDPDDGSSGEPNR